MARNYIQCELCKKIIDTCGIRQHLQWHQNESRRKEEYQKVKIQKSQPKSCRYCNKECKNENSLKQHEIRCSYNPNRLESSIIIGFNNRNRESPFKGKKFDPNDARWSRWAETRKRNTLIRHGCPELETELDDDGKLWSKWRNKIVNAEQEGLECLLTFPQYCQLVKEAGLKSSDLGFTGGGYVLARYNDTGNYEVGNCRFITQQQNADERVITERQREVGRINVKKMNEYNKLHDYVIIDGCKVLTEEASRRRSEAIKNSELYKRRKAEAVQKELQRRSKLDPRFSGNHNSQYGTRWITNGVENRKIHTGDEMPEGFYFGRVNCNQYRSS